jgi:hypothetical protein
VAKNSFAPTATDSIIHGRTAPPNRASPRCRRRADQRRPHTNGTRHSRRPTPTTTLYLYASRKPVRPHELSRVSRNSTLQQRRPSKELSLGASFGFLWTTPSVGEITEI